jgi:carbon monoxide dehydrogenase subunit G
MKSRFRSWLKSLRRDGVGIDPNRDRLPSRNRTNALEMTGTQRIEATREEVYAALNDTEVLRQCIPGCETIEKLSDTQMRATMTLKVGPVKASFKGMITLSDLDPPNGYRITGEGSGGAAGFAKGGANVRLTADGNATILEYRAKADVGGRLAQLGGCLIDGTATKLAGDFFEKFGAIIGKPQALEVAAGTPHEAGSLDKILGAIAALLKGWFGKLFGSSVASMLCLRGGRDVPATICTAFFATDHYITQKEAAGEVAPFRS